ncbi:hypothetical protein FKR81_31095 [Lentzea tibetensis]|uniref:Uncharacterized protein n=1 Tax=Lentzea tibetensis TaxID=2591470 RepID=A0A563ELA7_9PSEU|nr:hypothetical protein [Lentzea tibetensis]TWP47788.1 hypothetical protein FKR81_31095 [Lentzea tibetensis]
MLEQLVAQDRYRTISIIDRAGTPLLTVGEPALRTPGPLPVSADLRWQDGLTPVLFSFSWTEGADLTVVTEIDTEYVATTLRRLPGDVHLVDKDMHVLASAHGLSALDPVVETAAREAFAGRSGAHVSPDGRSVVAARSVEIRSSFSWVLVSQQPAGEINPAGAARQRVVRGLAGVGVLLGVLAGVRGASGNRR